MLTGIIPLLLSSWKGKKLKVRLISERQPCHHTLFDGADISTLVHEATGHLGRRMLENLAEHNQQFAAIMRQQKMGWRRGECLDPEAEEKFARGFERYLRDATHDKKLIPYHALKTFLTNIYRRS